MHNHPNCAAALAAGLAVICPTLLWAATKTATFNVTAQIIADCTITVSNLDFGNVPLLTATVSGQTNISVTCTNGSGYNVGLDAGNAAGSTITNRIMKSGANSLQYKLCSDSARTVNWGNTVGTDTVAGTGNSTAQTLPIYGLLPVQTTPPVGAYTSMVTATITF